MGADAHSPWMKFVIDFAFDSQIEIAYMKEFETISAREPATHCGAGMRYEAEFIAG
jgi:hypothetical protein